MILTALLLAACEISAPATTPPTAPPAPPNPPAKTTALPDLTQGMAANYCDNGPGEAGAASYFVGEITVDGTTVHGYERWVLQANEKWKAAGGSDCTIEWTITGTRVQQQRCTACSFGITATGTLRPGTTCPEGLWKKEEVQNLAYDVQLGPGERASVFFAKTGKRLGEGYRSGSRFNYISPPSCRWF